jgi:hypothetical protein
MWLNWHFSHHSSSQFSHISEVYHDAVLDTISLIAFEAYDCMVHSRVEYYICCTCVDYSTYFVFPTVSFVCQTSTVVPAVPAVSYYCAYMGHAIVSLYVLFQCAHMCVEYRLSFLFQLGIQFLDIHQHH